MSSLRFLLIGFLLIGLLASVCAPSAHAQIIQLPTFRQFSIGTTVVVPDRGAAYLGGVSRARYSGSSHGVPLLGPAGRLTRSRSASMEISGSHAYATATIHDLSKMDRAVLAAADARLPRHLVDAATRSRALFLSRHVGKRRTDRSDYSVLSVAELNQSAVRPHSSRLSASKKRGETTER